MALRDGQWIHVHDFGLSHPRDPNGSIVVAHAYDKHTASPNHLRAIVVGTDPLAYTCDVVLTTIRTNMGGPIIWRNVRVGGNYVGKGWGEHNLPWIGQEVELIAEHGITTNPAKAVIGRRFYNNVHKPPQHPLLSDQNYQKGHYEVCEGGSFIFKAADGKITRFSANLYSSDGTREARRSTGTPTTSIEARQNKARRNYRQMQNKLDQTKAAATQIQNAAQKVEQLQGVMDYLKKFRDKLLEPDPDPFGSSGTSGTVGVRG